MPRAEAPFRNPPDALRVTPGINRWVNPGVIPRAGRPIDQLIPRTQGVDKRVARLRDTALTIALHTIGCKPVAPTKR